MHVGPHARRASQRMCCSFVRVMRVSTICYGATITHSLLPTSCCNTSVHACVAMRLMRRRNLYFDVGASNWAGISQSWMVTEYDSHDILFNRHLLWEATVASGPDLVKVGGGRGGRGMI